VCVMCVSVGEMETGQICVYARTYVYIHNSIYIDIYMYIYLHIYARNRYITAYLCPQLEPQQVMVALLHMSLTRGTCTLLHDLLTRHTNFPSVP